MNIKQICLLLCSFLFLNSLSAGTIEGYVKDESGNPLAFAAVYVQGGTTGTATNNDGFYSLSLPKGDYSIVFRYVGFQQETRKISVSAATQTLDIVLKSNDFELKGVEISAGGEDPAYRVIREAIKKRSYYKNQVESYKCDVYVKGNNRLLNAPKKMMGQAVGDLGGSLDSTGKGIIYLSETVSKLSYRKPNDFKEEMISSKVSGNDNGFSFNNAREMNFSFYENRLDLGRPLLSPIAEGAMLSYKYKLEGTFYDENKKMINRIKVIPKRETEPAFEGYIYITEDLWNIYSLELTATKNATKIDLIDSVTFRQHYRTVKDDVYMVYSQSISFNAKVFGFHFRGDYVAVYNNYILNPDFEKRTFGNAVTVVADSANQKTDDYWNSVRPVPLTSEEVADYIKKDSIQKVRTSKPYLDSLDRRNNKFKAIDLLMGYSFSRSYKNMYFNVLPVLNSIGFNPVQGWKIGSGITLKKDFDRRGIKRLESGATIQYGFSDKQIRGEAKLSYQFNLSNFAYLEAQGGRILTQFNGNEPVSDMTNQLYCLLGKRNEARFYDKRFATVKGRIEPFNGLRIEGALEYADRRLVENTTNYSFLKKDRSYWANTPPELMNDSLDQVATKGFQLAVLDLDFTIKFKQQYMQYPQKKILLGSKYPTLHLKAKIAPIKNENFSQFVHLAAQVKYDLGLGLVGYSEFNIESGFFLSKDNLNPIDYKHFNGNQTFLTRPNRYMETFQLLPYYTFSTSGYYVQGHYQHNFNGFIFNKIPLLKRTGFQEMAGFHILHTEDKPLYLETNFGVGNIGYKLFRILRVDWVMGWQADTKDFSYGVVVGVNLGQ